MKRILSLCWAMVGVWLMLGVVGVAQLGTTTVSDTVYHADGSPAQGTLLISWPQFTTASGATVAAGSTSVTLGVGGGLSVTLAPNAGGSPIGSYYTVVYHLDDGTLTRENWMVPVSGSPVHLAAVRSTVMPTSVAMQTVTKGYVQSAIASALATTAMPQRSGEVYYFEGSSITRGYLAGGAQLPGGGLTGCYGDLVAKSAWGAGHGTYYNDGVDGATSTMDVAQYTTGNSVYGVTVPSAHSVSPAVTGQTARAYYFLDLTEIFNDYAAGISTATSIANLTTLTTAAQADGYFVVILTSPQVVPGNATATQQIEDTDQAVRNGTIPSNMVADWATWIADVNDTEFWNSGGIHPNANGHRVTAANLEACMEAGGCQVAYSGNYIAAPVTFGGYPTFTGGFLTTASPTFESGGVDVAFVQNLGATLYSTIAFNDNLGTRQMVFGYGNSASAVPSTGFMDMKTGSAFALQQSGNTRLGWDAAGNVSVSGTTSHVSTPVFDGTASMGSDAAPFYFYDAGAGSRMGVQAQPGYSTDLFMADVGGASVNLCKLAGSGTFTCYLSVAHDTGVTTVTGIAPAQSTPGGSSSTCVAGEIWSDANYIYACTVTNTVKRAALSSF